MIARTRTLKPARMRMAVLAAVLVAGLALVDAAGPKASVARGGGAVATSPAADASVVTAWNATAVATIFTDTVKMPSEGYLYLGFTQAAVYNAVVGITRDYDLYKWHRHGPRHASPGAAAASAAHRILLYYFPGSAGRLDADYATSLAGIPDGWAKAAGKTYGERAAQRIIALRAHDGRDVPLDFDVPLGPGVWRPISDPPVPFFGTWLSRVRPLVMNSPKQFRPGPPPALTSVKYAKEFNEVKSLGAATGSTRTPDQTETAMFFSDVGVGALQASIRDLATRRAWSISDSARVFAAVDVSVADAIIATWDAKFHYGFWRPTTAIQLADTDDNPATEADPAWTSLLTVPPYPDYTSGLNSIIGSASRALARALGTNRIDLFITSAAAGVTRHYAWTGPLNRDAIDARVWGGLHFRTADVVGNHRAQRVATFVFGHAFQPRN